MVARTKDIDARMAEEMLLASLLYKPDKIVEVIDEVNPSIFSVQEFGRIYKCIVELYKDNVIPDEVMVMNKACSLGYEIAPELVRKLSNSKTFVAKRQLKQYCNVIKTSAFKRKTLDLCTDFLEKQKDNNKTPEQLVNDFFTLAINLNDQMKPAHNVSTIDIDTSDLMSNLDYRYENPNVITGIPFGFPFIDKYMDGAEKGDIITIGGQNSHGKSLFAQSCMLNMALWLLKQKRKEKILFFSLEMTRKQMERRLISILTGINGKYLKNPRQYFIDKHIQDTPENFEKFKKNIANATEFLNKLPIIIDDSSVLTAEEIMATIKKYTLKDGLACVYLDYVGLVANGYQEDYQNIAYTYKVLKQVAKDTQIPICILNQYLKDFKGREKTGFKPNMFDMAGGKSAMNDSMKIIHVWKPDKFEDFVSKNPQYLGKIVVFSDKNRDGVFGDMPEDLLTFIDGQLREVEEIRKENQATASEIFVGVNAENVK